MARQILVRDDGVELAFQALPGFGPTIVFLHGFGSSMAGEKAEALAAWCARTGHGMLRLDVSGHGDSGGRFEAGTIGIWRDDALAVIDRHSRGPLLLVGSSMGGWLALLVALARPDRVAGLVGIAAAPDFTEDLMWEAATPLERRALMQTGHIDMPSAYGPPLRIARSLIEDGRTHLLLRGPIPLHIPVRLLHGSRDPDVPWETALRLAERIEGDDVQVTLVKDGDHRLSRPTDLALLCRILAGLVGEDGGEPLAETGVAPA